MKGILSLSLAGFVLCAPSTVHADETPIHLPAEASPPKSPDGFVAITGGTYKMGDHFDEAPARELPVHTVTVDGFHMHATEVTSDQMVAILNWAFKKRKVEVEDDHVRLTGSSEVLVDISAPLGNIGWDPGSRSFFVRGEKGPGYPAVDIKWHGAAAYCNFLSEMQSLEPAYSFKDWTCDFSKDAYRLPTEAEWEWAARGGDTGKRFPWGGNEISHANANYHAIPEYPYDVADPKGFHPLARTGKAPYLLPVRSLPATPVGLFEICGNAREWCHDWYQEDYYVNSPRLNPRGPDTGEYRSVRGGHYFAYARGCRVSWREWAMAPNHGSYGFRPVRPIRMP